MRSKRVLGAGMAVIAAFLVVTNPVMSAAAGQITGKQMKDNSVTGKDVKTQFDAQRLQRLSNWPQGPRGPGPCAGIF